MTMRMFRQGDVLIEQIETLPKGKLDEVPREGGRVILAHGEVTGHAHALTDQSAVLMSFRTMDPRGRPEELRFLKVGKQSTLSHEEHGPIELPSGTYKVTIQRQWDQSQGWTNVVD
jgi:hypothetical protein